MRSVSGQKYESVFSMKARTATTPTFITAIGIMYLFFNDRGFFFFLLPGAEWACRLFLCIESSGKGREGDKKPLANIFSLSRSDFIAYVSVPLWLVPSKLTPSLIEWHNLFLQTAWANWLSFRRMPHYNFQHPRHPVCHSEYSHQVITPDPPLTAKPLQTDAGYRVGGDQLHQCLISHLKWPKALQLSPLTSQSVRKSEGAAGKRWWRCWRVNNKISDTECVFNSACTAAYLFQDFQFCDAAFLVQQTALNSPEKPQWSNNSADRRNKKRRGGWKWSVKMKRFTGWRFNFMVCSHCFCPSVST